MSADAGFVMPESLDRRRQIMARHSGSTVMGELDRKVRFGPVDKIATSMWLTQSVKHPHRKHVINIPLRDVIDKRDLTNLHPGGQPVAVIDLILLCD